MLQEVWGTDKDLAGQSIIKWYEGRLGDKIHPPFSGVAWVNEWGAFTSAVMFDHYTGANVEAHIQSERRVTRRLLNTVGVFVFDKLKCIRLTAKSHRDNKKLLHLLPKMGFKYECTLKRYFGDSRDKDALVFVMYRDDAVKKKWIK